MSEPSQTNSSSALTPAQVDLTNEPDSISELFANPRCDWDEKAMDRIVSKYRDQRKDLDAGVKVKKEKVAAIPKEDLSGISGADLLGKLGL